MSSAKRAKQRSTAKVAPPIRLLIADDHPVVREGLRSLLSLQKDMRVIAEAANGEEALQEYIRHSPDVVLMDLRMPKMDGISALDAILRHAPDARIILLTTYDDDEDIYRGLRAGAKSYVLKDTSREELASTIRVVREGRTRVPEAIAAKLAARLRAPSMTLREMEVLRLMAEGKSNREIGQHLHIAEPTVKVHVSRLLKKLDVSARTEAVSVAMQRGLVRLGDKLSSG